MQENGHVKESSERCSRSLNWKNPKTRMAQMQEKNCRFPAKDSDLWQIFQLGPSILSMHFRMLVGILTTSLHIVGSWSNNHSCHPRFYCLWCNLTLCSLWNERCTVALLTRSRVRKMMILTQCKLTLRIVLTSCPDELPFSDGTWVSRMPALLLLISHR